MAPRKPRIALSGPASGLNTPFAGLAIPDLPPAPPEAALPAEPAAKKRGRVVLRREKAHRGGKSVVVVDSFPSHCLLAEIEALASVLRRACGCGGTVRERAIEIQGDAVEKVRALLEEAGFTVAGVR